MTVFVAGLEPDPIMYIMFHSDQLQPETLTQSAFPRLAVLRLCMAFYCLEHGNCLPFFS